MKRPGSAPLRLVSQCYSTPKFSNDGSMIAHIGFETNEFMEFYLRICDINGDEIKKWRLGHSNEFAAKIRGITWSPEDSYVAVLNELDEIIYFEVSSGEKQRVKLLNKEGYHFSAISWNPKNNKIALAEVYSYWLSIKDEINSNIWLIDAFDDAPLKEPNRPIYSNIGSPVIAIGHLDWSPDGSMLVYSEDYSYSPIFTINADGSNNKEIILNGVFEDENISGSGPCWMSNGEQIVFFGHKPGDKFGTVYEGLFITNFNGSYKVDLDIVGYAPDCF